MTTSQLRFRRKLADALYGEVMECELRPSTLQRQRIPSLSPLDKHLVVAVKCVSLPYAAIASECLKPWTTPCRSAASPVYSPTPTPTPTPSRQEPEEQGGHPNVVRSYFHFSQHDCLYLVSEFCADGDLHTHLTAATANGSMDEPTSVHFMRQILSGVHFLHRQLGIAHRDLSLENVLMHDGQCKISDFGLSVSVGSRCVGPVGKAYCMAPEVVAGGEYDPAKADVWSLGVMWFVLLTGSPLVPIASRQNKAFAALEQCGVAAVLESWGVSDRLSTAVVELISQMLTVEPTKRISLGAIMECPLLQPSGSC